METRSKTMISTAADETKVKKLFPNEDLHGLYEKRICFSYELLENIFNSNKKIKNLNKKKSNQ